MASTKKIITEFIDKTYDVKVGSDWIAFGIRACKPDGDGNDLIETDNKFNVYNDTIGIINKDECRVYLGTVEPGKTYTDKPMNSNGVFYLKDGIYQFVRAKHFGNDAFNIIGKYPKGPIEGYRDSERKGINPGQKDTNGNIINKNAKIYTDATGVDIHAGGDDLNNIAGQSAGCQVFYGNWKTKNWLEFRDAFYKSKPKIFIYCLLGYYDIRKQVEA